jgi:hypothetical protein
MNKIWIPDPVSVCPVHDRVSCTVAIGDVADAPQTVAAGYDFGQILGATAGDDTPSSEAEPPELACTDFRATLSCVFTAHR